MALFSSNRVILLVVAIIAMTAMPVTYSQSPCPASVRIIVRVPETFDFRRIITQGPIYITVPDPAPNLNTPGSYGCSGCPYTNMTEPFAMNFSSTTNTFTGTVTGATGDGIWYIQQATNKRQPTLSSLRGVIPTDGSTGDYAFTAPLFCGTQIIKCVWSNARGRYVLVVQIIADNCQVADIRVTLTWQRIGTDYDLHLVRPGGCLRTNNDCYYGNTHPDWGTSGDPRDDPQLDVDCISTCSVENIFLAQPESGTYDVYVHHYSGDNTVPGTVIFNVNGQSTVAVPFTGISPINNYQLFGTIEWPSGIIRTSGITPGCPSTTGAK
jgi:hypothetical protein